MRKAFISPPKYVQGADEIENLGFFVKGFGDRALLIAHPDDVDRVREKIDKTSANYNVTFFETNFKGECSRGEVARLKELAKAQNCSCTVGLGGGKAIDTAKCVAEGEAVIIVPTIAATDAPTSHSAVLYTDDGRFDDYAYFKQSPSVVLVDTAVIANAPTRFLVSGMGDALSTYFEARATMNAGAFVNAGLPCGARQDEALKANATNAAFAMAKLCYENLLKFGLAAKEASDRNEVNEALETIVESNILLSGIGFESGGLAAAHAVHDGLTALEGTHKFFHGEKVAFGTLVQLALEKAPWAEVEEVMTFIHSVGLPLCLADIGVENITDEELELVAKKACIAEESIHSMPFAVTEKMVEDAILSADKMGLCFKKSLEK